MNRLFIRKHINSFSILLFIALFSMIVYTKPSIILKKMVQLDNLELIQNKQSYLFAATIILAFLSYLIVLSLLLNPNCNYLYYF